MAQARVAQTAERGFHDGHRRQRGPDGVNQFGPHHDVASPWLMYAAWMALTRSGFPWSRSVASYVLYQPYVFAPPHALVPTIIQRYLSVVRGRLACSGTARSLIAVAHLAQLAVVHSGRVSSFNREVECVNGAHR